MTDPDTELAEAASCPRCDGHGLLSVLLPRPRAHGDGEPAPGHVPVTLCADCDADDPIAGALLTWFHVHGLVEPQRWQEFGALFTRWADSVGLPELDDAALETEFEAWRRGIL